MTEQSTEDLLKIKYESLILLKDRGYVIPSDESAILNGKIKQQEFKNLYTKIQNDTTHPLYDYFINNPLRVAMSNVYYKDGSKCLVYFADSYSFEKKIAESSVANFCKLIISQNVDEAIIVSAAPESNTVDSICTDFIRRKDGETYGVFIQFFKDEELKFNPMTHVMVPKHKLLNKKEIDELEKIDKINLKNLPKISAFDPICKRLGAKDKDVVEILRTIIVENCLISEEITYRYVFVPHVNKTKK
jgi:DNA-directed RNA polymerase subunit H (RpoH/RPB5)